MVAALPQVITSFTKYLSDSWPKITRAGIDILKNLITGIIGAIPDLVASLPLIINAIITGIENLMDGVVDVGKAIVEGIWEGIAGAADWLVGKVTGFFGDIVGGVKDFLGIHSPSTVFADMGKNMALGLGQGWDNEYDRIRRDIEGGMDFGTAQVDFASSGLGLASAGMVNGISAAVQSNGVSGGNFVFNLMMPDGTKFASYLFGPLADYAKANGTPILSPS